MRSRARSGHAGAPRSRNRAAAIMADKRPGLGRHCLERVTVRVTGIEPALSAWESDRLGSMTALTWAADIPLVTVMDPAAPGLMARQWPQTDRPGCRRGANLARKPSMRMRSMMVGGGRLRRSGMCRSLAATFRPSRCCNCTLHGFQRRGLG
jgi:hypothetical protein